MKHAVQQVMEERAQRLVDVGSLPALMAMTTQQRSAAVQTGLLVRVPIIATFAVGWF